MSFSNKRLLPLLMGHMALLPPIWRVEGIVLMLSHVGLFAIPWTVALQAPLSMGFPRPEYWSGLPFPSPGDLFNLRIEPGSLTLQEISCHAGGFFTIWVTRVMVPNGLRKGNWQLWNVLTVSCPFCYWILVSTLVYPVYVSHSVVSESLSSHGLYVACQAPLSMEFSRQESWSR